MSEAACYFVVCVGGDIDLKHPAMRRYYELAVQAEIETKTKIEALTDEVRLPEVVVGKLPGHGLGIERYPSMEQFWSYWNSDLYRKAKEIRNNELALEIAFAVCLPGRLAEDLPAIGPTVGWSVSVLDDASQLDVDSEEVVAIASDNELEVIEGENPFPGKVWVVQIHPSKDVAEKDSPQGADLHAVMLGASPEQCDGEESMSLPVAKQWFVRKKVDDQITLITEPNVHPFLRCNIWHVRGRDRDLLVDTGMGIADLIDASKDLFEKQISVVLTHSHIDHAGGAHEFDHCYIHSAEASKVNLAEDQLPLATDLWPDDVLEMMVVDGPIGEYVISAIPHDSFDPGAYRLKPACNTTLLEEGDVIDLGDRVFEVLHLPGHSPGSIGLWEKKSGTLFSGDAVYDSNLLDDLPESDQDQYRRTMQRLLKLPVSVVHGGHDRSFGRERLKEIAKAYLDGRKLEYASS